MKAKCIIWCATAAALATLSASAVTLSEGDPAPKITVSKWIQGEPVTAFQPGTAYLVEFWSTWWTPSLEALAHVNDLHQKYKNKGLVVIGQDVKERPTTQVESFVKRMGNLMSYRVALDAGGTNRWVGKMQESWLYTAEAGIPTAFIIDKKGKICFIGHPDDIDDALIEQVLADTFDVKKRALAREAAAAKVEEWELHNDLGKVAFKAKQWAKAMSEIDQLEKILPQKRVTTHCMRLAVLMGQEDFDGASKLALKLSKESPDDPFLQHRLARTIAKGSPKNTVLLNTANQLMERAVAKLKGPMPDFLHTQARLAFLQGKKENAIQLETEALRASEPDTSEQFEIALNSFKQGKLPQ